MNFLSINIVHKYKAIVDIYFVCIYIFSQYGMSCFSPAHLPFGSWSDAQKECDKNGSHLWTINSHEEWYNVYTKRLLHVPDRITGQARLFSGAIFDPLVAQHFFIGLVHSTQPGVIEVQSQ